MQTHGTRVGGRMPGAVGGHALTEHGWVGAGLDKLVTMQTHVWVGACLDQWVAVQTHGTWVGGCRPGSVGGRAHTRNTCGWVQAWTSGWPCRHTEHVWVCAGLDQ